MEKPQKRFRSLSSPKFESTIPSHLLVKLSEHEVWLYGSVSRMEQSSKWVEQQLVQTSEELSRFDEEFNDWTKRIEELERWKMIFSAKGTIIISIIVLLMSGIISAFSKVLVEKWVPKNSEPPSVIYVPWMGSSSTNFQEGRNYDRKP